MTAEYDAKLSPVHEKLALYGEILRELMNLARCPSESWIQERSLAIGTQVEYARPFNGGPKLGLADLPMARIYPAHPERFPSRAKVDDPIPRIELLGDDDYGNGLGRHWREIKRGFLLLEWDIAIDASDWFEMAACVYLEPNTIWAGPYFLHYGRESLQRPSQVPDPSRQRPDGTVDFVPLGMTYLPAVVLAAMEADGIWGSIRYSRAEGPDFTFNRWADTHGFVRRICHGARPKHLHWGHSTSFAPKEG